MKIPVNAPPEVIEAFKDIERELDRMKGRRGQVDLAGQRIGNAGTPVLDRDYVNKSYLDNAIDAIKKQVLGLTKKTKAVVVSGGAGTPAPTGGAIDFGYYRVDTKQPIAGDYGAEVKPYTNLVYLGIVDSGDSTTPTSERITNMAASMARLKANGFKIMLDVEMGGGGQLSVAQVLDLARPHWEAVKYLVLGEVELDHTLTNSLINSLKTQVQNRGLAMKPIGFVADDPEIVIRADLTRYNFDFAGLEAYSPTVPCGTNPTFEVERIRTSLSRQKSAVPPNMFLVIVMQGYNRNGACDNVAVMEAINRATYFEMVKGDARVKAVTIFAYARPGGTRDHPTVKAIHQEIWRDISGGTQAPAVAKKCLNDPRNCVGVLSCCDGGSTNPCNCPRLCSADIQFASLVEASTHAAMQANPGLFASPGRLLNEASALLFARAVATTFTSTNPTLKAVHDPADGKQILVRRLVGAEFREDYRVWNTDLTVAFPSGSGYRATCYGVPLDF